MRPIFPKAKSCVQAMVWSGTDFPVRVPSLTGWKARATKFPAETFCELTACLS
jgi:hypothetical protein